MSAHVRFRSVSNPDFDYSFNWNDVSTLILPEVGDTASMYQKGGRRVTERQFHYVVDGEIQRADITFIVE